MHDSHAPAAAHPHDIGGLDSHAAQHPHVNYRWIFYALCACTILSWLADKAFDWGLINNRRIIAVMVLAVAVAKAQYVMRYFMHLKFEGKWKYVLLLPTAILACGIPLALAPDIGLHYYVPEVPQIRTQSTARGGHHASAAHDEATSHDEAEHPAAGHDAAADHEAH